MSDDGITSEQYLAQLKKLGLSPTRFRYNKHTIYNTADGDTISVLDPDGQTVEQRAETLQRVRDRLGISEQP